MHEKQISKLVNSTRGGDWSAREKWEENGHLRQIDWSKLHEK